MPGRDLHEVKQSIFALDTWRNWAVGRNVSHEEVATAVEALLDLPEATPLAGAVVLWAEVNDVDLNLCERISERESLGLDIGL